MKVNHEKDIGRWTAFVVKGDLHKFEEIKKWLEQNNIRYVSDKKRITHTFFLRDRSHALAFKLKWC